MQTAVMDRDWRARNTRVLWTMVLLAAAYAGLHMYLRNLGAANIADGSLGVLLGLYICSHPAANAVNLLFFERDALRQMLARGDGTGWLILNVLVLAAGWIDIFIGVVRFATRAVP